MIAQRKIIMKFKKLLKLLFGVLMAAFFIWLMLRSVDIASLKDALIRVRLGWIFLALLALLVGYAIRIQRWHLMLSVDNPDLSWHACVGPLLGGFAMNNILPFRAGDFIRTFAFNNQLGVTPSGVLATLFIERLLDLLMLLFFLIVGLHLFNVDIGLLFNIGELAIVFFSIGILFLLLMPNLLKPLPFFICTQLSKLLPGVAQRIKVTLDHIFSVLHHLSGIRLMAILLAWSLLAWLLEGFAFLFVAISLPGLDNVSASWLALSVGTLSTLIPSTPGYIGTFDFFTSESMKIFSNSAASSIAFAFLIHLVIWGPITLIGGFYMLINALGGKTISNRATYE